MSGEVVEWWEQAVAQLSTPIEDDGYYYAPPAKLAQWETGQAEVPALAEGETYTYIIDAEPLPFPSWEAGLEFIVLKTCTPRVIDFKLGPDRRVAERAPRRTMVRRGGFRKVLDPPGPWTRETLSPGGHYANRYPPDRGPHRSGLTSPSVHRSAASGRRSASRRPSRMGGVR